MPTPAESGNRIQTPFPHAKSGWRFSLSRQDAMLQRNQATVTHMNQALAGPLGRWSFLGACALASFDVDADSVPVANAAELSAAIQNATAGNDIVLAAGTYAVTGNLICSASGTAQAPIRVRAATPRSVLIQFSGGLIEGFKVSGSNWIFEGLDIEGVCAADDDCEHAFHLSGNADFTVIRNNLVRDFNAQIKSNIAPGFGFPDDVLIERNNLYDTRARNTANPVTKIDVVGGRRWIVRSNTIHDFAQGAGGMISYGAFLKGNSRDGLFERNLVRCEQDFSGGTRVGLSFGGGGTAPDSICEDATCTPEHQNGIMRNNIIMNCSDVGIYLNESAETSVQHNTLYATLGIDVRFAASSADLRNNLLGGMIRDRDGASHTSAGDVAAVSDTTFAAWFQAPQDADFDLVDGAAIVDLGVAAPLVSDDFCGNDRNDGAADIGALEYDPLLTCDTNVGGGVARVIFADGFEVH
jgi:parallel beta-helix repeat protein